MLTVLTGCWGDRYPADYAERWRRSVERNITIPHRTEIVWDEPEFPGWWGKVALFQRTGPHLWLDLDSVITGSLDVLAGTNAQMRIARNWARSGHGGCQSSVMYWEDARPVYDLFDAAHVQWPPSNENGALWGDQEWITLLRDTQRLKVDYFKPEHVVSYKYHCKTRVPDDARVVCFHGDPKPDKVSKKWVKDCWR